MIITKDQWETIQTRWLTEVYANASTIDPNNEHDWGTLALGFLLANSVPFAQCRYAILCEMACGGDYVPMDLGEDES